MKLSQWIERDQSAPLQFRSGFYFQMALGLLVIPFRWLCAWVLAAMIHEVGHIIAIVGSGHRIGKIVFKGLGAEICTDSLGSDEWFCAMAGPVTSLLLILLCRSFPLIGICAFFQTVVNLIPFPPLDGGRVLKGLLCFLFDARAADKYTEIFGVMIVIVAALTLWKICGVNMGFAVAGMCIIIMLKILHIKIPCKRRNKWVQ